MSGRVRAEISKSNPYWIPKHRLYELKHFCLQYPEWQKAYNALLGVSGRAFSTDPIKKTIRFSSPTERTGMLRAYYSRNMELVRTAAERTDPTLSEYIFLGVTEGWSYDILKARFNMPCGKDTYYDAYRRFFWILSKERD